MMRITNSMMVNDLRRNMNNSLLRMDELQRQLSTNRRINKPSDDPAGIVKALRLHTNLTEGEQYMANISDAKSFMQTSDDAMNSITEIMHKIRELTVKAATGTQDADANAAVAKEISQLNEQLKLVSNSGYGSKYIFAGTNVTETPYIDGQWIGNNQLMEVEIGVGVKIPVNLQMRDFFMGKLDQLNIEKASGIGGLEARELQEGSYQLKTHVLTADTNAKVTEAQSYLSSVDNNKSFFFEEGANPASLGAGKTAAAADSQYNGSIMMEVKSVKTGVANGEPRASLDTSAGIVLDFGDKPMYLKNWEGEEKLLPSGDLSAHFTYTKAGASTAVLSSADYDNTTHAVTFTTTGTPAEGDTIIWNNEEIAGTPAVPGGSKLHAELSPASPPPPAEPTVGTELTPAYTPVKMVYHNGQWVYDDAARVTVDLKAHLYNSAGEHKYVELENVELDMEAANGGAIFTLTADKIGDPSFTEDLVIWNSGGQLGSIDPKNTEIKAGDKTIISLTAAQATDAQQVDIGCTYMDRYGVKMKERTQSFAFDNGYFNDKTQELKFFSLNEETGLSYDGSISLITNEFTTQTAEPAASFDFKAGLFSYVNDLARKVTVGKLPQVGNELAGNDSRMQEILLYRSTIGARINRLELQSSRLDSSQELYTELLAYYEDANAAEVIMNLKMQENVYQSALSAGARIIQPSLVDFLR